MWDATSSRLTLAIMAGVTAILPPVVLGNTAWVYRVLRGPVTAERIAAAFAALNAMWLELSPGLGLPDDREQ